MASIDFFKVVVGVVGDDGRFDEWGSGTTMDDSARLYQYLFCEKSTSL